MFNRRNAAALIASAVLASKAHAQAAAPLTRIAFGSCADEDKPQPIWDAVLAYRPELFIFAGDNVYGDSTDGKPVVNPLDLIPALKDSYERAKKVPGLMAVKNNIRHLAIWDDHDYGLNDGGADFSGKHDAKALFLDFWNVPANDPRRSRDGLYHSEIVGAAGKRAQIILLDTRFFRSPLKRDPAGSSGLGRYVPDDDPAKTILGEAQWAWLGEQLRQPAELRLIVSTVQVLADGHKWERWGNFPLELQKLRDLIGGTRANGVVLLSGDRHIGGLYRDAGGLPYPLVEITSSGLTESWANSPENSANSVGAIYGAVNFGTVDIDWWERRVTLALRGMNGEKVRELAIAFDVLKAP